MALRQRERIRRNTETEQTCEACGSSMLDTWSRVMKVGKYHLNLCSTCQGAARGGTESLLDHLHEIERNRPGEVNQDLLGEL